MKKVRRLFAFLMSMAMLITCVSIPVSINAASAEYAATLTAKGFPQSYLPMLLTLHDQHPNWNFEPLLVSQAKSQYTFDYVVAQEGADPSNNLVIQSTWAPQPFTSLGDSNYAPYRVNNGVYYDTGTWLAASNNAIRYFMDARNFLNQYDIFMFEDLKLNSQVTLQQVESLLRGTFMDGVYLENGYTYAQYFYSIGQQLGVSPLHLASRVRQEQGEGTSRLISGESGYYNYFNIGASGNTTAEVYQNGVNEAVQGGWNTRWKAIYGGATKIANKYVNCYQNTLYLQKFNVDPRSNNNFWGQYMQNISAPLTEGRTTRNAFANEGCIDLSFTFQIPVYNGMPSAPSADPGNGITYYSYTTAPVTSYAYAPANEGYNCLDTGSGVAYNGVSTASYIFNCGDSNTIALNGWSVNTAGTRGFVYNVDGGTNVAIPSVKRLDVLNAFPAYANYCDSDNIGFGGSYNTSSLSAGDHTLKIYAKNNSGSTYLVVTISITIKAVVRGYYTNLEGGTGVVANGVSTSTYSANYHVSSVLALRGWSVNAEGTTGFYYTVDGGSKVALAKESRGDVINAFAAFGAVCSATNVGFNGTYNTQNLSAGSHTVAIYAYKNNGSAYKVAQITVTINQIQMPEGYYNTLDTGNGTVANGVSSGSYTATYGVNNSISLGGWSVNAAGTNSFYYKVDNGAKVTLEKVKRLDVINAYPLFALTCDSANVGFTGSFNTQCLIPGNHTLSIYAINNAGDSYLVANVSIKITASAGTYKTTIDNVNGASVAQTRTSANIALNVTRARGNTSAMYVQGWSVHSKGVSRFEYTINNGSWASLNSSFRRDVYNATKKAYPLCTSVNSFIGNINTSALPVGTYTITIRGVAANGTYFAVSTINLTIA